MKKIYTSFMLLAILMFSSNLFAGEDPFIEYEKTRQQIIQLYTTNSFQADMWDVVFPVTRPYFMKQHNDHQYAGMIHSSSTREGGLLTDMMYYEWELGVWEEFLKSKYTYDGNLYLSEVLSMAMIEGIWVNAQRSLYTNNASGQCLEMLFQTWSADVRSWQDATHTTYTYDGNGNLIGELMEMWMGTGWENWMKITHTYDNNQLQQSMQENWDFMTQNWKNSTLNIYSYLGNGNLSEDLRQIWETTRAWVNDEITYYQYNGQGQNHETDIDDWDGSSWVNFYHIENTFDGNGNKIEAFTEIWENNAWVNCFHDTMMYDGNNWLIEMVVQEWESNAWVNAMKVVYTYMPVGIIDPGYGTASEILLYNTPNPFSDQTIIHFKLNENSNVSITLWDITGKQVRILIDRQFNAGLHEVNWNAENNRGSKVSNGIYFCRLQAGNESVVVKIILMP